MKQILRKGKKEGSVLFTVVAVMLVMVVFLMSTMVLTTSANRRAYYSYFETQAQYAAQAALDAVTNSAYSDENFFKWVQDSTNKYKDDKTANPIPQVTVDFTGSGIRFTDNNSEVVCTIEKAGNNTLVWDEATQAVHEQTAYKVTATASVGNGRNQSDYTVVNYIYENFQVPKGKLPSVDNYARNTVHKWNKSTDTDTDDKESGSIASAVYSLAIANTGNNITYFGPQNSGMTNMPDGRGCYSASNAITLTKTNANYAIGNAQYVGNYVATNINWFTFQRFGEYAQFYGDLSLSGSQAGHAPNKGMHFDAKLSSSEYARYSNGVPYTDIPYVYVDGQLKVGDGTGVYMGGDDRIGAAKDATYRDAAGFQNVNLYCGGIEMGDDGGTDLVIGGDAYLYDPELQSNIEGMYDGITALTRFVDDNLNKADTQWSDYNVGGNIICNNSKLTLNAAKSGDNDTNHTLVINGDVIFTNPSGTLEIAGKTKVEGRVICSGTLLNLENLDCGTIITPTYAKEAGNQVTLAGMSDQEIKAYGVDGLLDTGKYIYKYYDTDNYSKYCRDYNDYKGRSDNQLLMPYNMRWDEIFDEFYRWDLWQENEAAASYESIKNDPLVSESFAAGHDWQVKKFPGDATHKTIYVPYTTAKSGSNFINHYEPLWGEAKVAEKITADFNISSLKAFEDKFKLNKDTPKYDAGSMSGKKDVQVLYHSTSDGKAYNETLSNAVIIKDSCYLKLTTNGGGQNIFIDPYANSHSNSNPLCIVMSGGGAGNIVINNNAIYSGGDYSKPAEKSSEAGRREVFIFFDDTLTGNCSPALNILMSGIYYYVKNSPNKAINLVSNPIYPSNPQWKGLGNDIKYAYEYVPNCVIFGKEDTTYKFNPVGIINAEIIMPKSGLDMTGSVGNKCDFWYREYPDSSPFDLDVSEQASHNQGLNCCGIGAITIRDVQSDFACFAYIGDKNRGSSSEETISEGKSDDYDARSARLGSNDIDYFNNDHLGAS